MKRKSLLFALLLALFMPWAANAQTVTIGTGTNAHNSAPIANYYNYSLAEMLFTSAEIGTTDVNTILSLGFEGAAASSKTYGITVYMKNVDATGFTANTDYIQVSESDVVYTGSIKPESGWNTINLAEPFAYDNTKSLLVVVNKTSGDYAGSTSIWKYTSTSSPYMMLYAQNDGSSYNPTTLTSLATHLERPNVQLTFGTPPSCTAPTSVTATLDGNITWEGEGTTWNLNYKTSSASTWTEVNGITSMSYTIPNLANLTTYSVRVQNVCDDNTTTGWTYADDFTTPAGIPLNEDFGASSIPNGWTKYTGLLDDVMAGTLAPATTPSGWNFGTSNGVFDSHARVNIYGTGIKYWLVTPSLEMENNVQLTFDLALTKYSGTLQEIDKTLGEDDRFVVLITTDGGTTWEILREWNNTGSEYVYNDIVCSAIGEAVAIDLSSYAGQSIAVAFYGESTVSESGSDNNLHIDNVSIDYIPSCAKPTGLAKSDVTAHEATISWTSDAAAWQVQLNDEDPIDVEETTYTFENLTPETAYTAKVRANCDGTYSEWTNAVSFTTAIACPVPTSFATSNVGAHSVTLNWTSEASEWVVAYKTSAEEEFTEVTVTEIPYVLEGLTAETAYTVKVKAVCGGIDGESQYTSIRSFTTTVACPAPGNLEVSNLTATGATLTWTELGDGTSWFICLDGDETNYIEVGETTYTFRDGELESETVHTAKVKSDCGTAWSSIVEFEPTAKLVIGSGSGTSGYVPTNTNYNYSFSQQIYTVEELGEAGLFESIDFYMTSTSAYTRNLDIYMVSTDKNAFESNADWIAVTAADLVFSGEVAFEPQSWTTITLDAGFVYNGTQNVAIIVDDNTGVYSSRYFKSFTTNTIQSHYYYQDGSDIDPNSPSATYNYTGSSKNQIRILKSELSDCMKPTQLTATEVGPNFAKLSWTENGESTEWVVNYNGNTVTANTNENFELALEPETEYTITVAPTCDETLVSIAITITTPVACPVPNELTVSDITFNAATVSWTGYNDSYNVQLGWDDEPEILLSVDFENQAIPTQFVNDETYAWTVTDTLTSGYCMRSGNPGVGSSTSAISVIVAYTIDGTVEFDAECRGEGSSTAWDKCIFSIDDVAQFTYGAAVTGWNHYTFDVPAGEHTFTWSYTKDSSVDNPGDYFAVDNVVMTATDVVWGDPIMGLANAEYTFEDLTSGANYYVKVQGFCGETPTEESEVVSFTTLACARPTDLNVTDVDFFSATVDWTENGDCGEWYVYYGPDLENFIVVTEHPYTLTNLTPDTEYQVNVIPACGNDDPGTYGSEVLTFSTSAPATLTIEGYGEDNTGETGWYLIASPLAEAVAPTAVENLINENGYDLYRFNQSAEKEWENYKGHQDGFMLEPGTGYLYANSEDVTLKFYGTPYYGDYVVQLIRAEEAAPENRGWNLVGNPFNEYCYITDERDFYVMNEYGGDLFVGRRYLNPMEGGFVYAAEDDETITLTNLDPADAKSANVSLNLSNGSAVIDRAIVRFGEGRQLPKFQLRASSTKLAIAQDNGEYAVVRSANEGEMPVNFKAEKNGSYTISVNSENVEFGYLHLIDNKTGADIDLLSTPSYSFEASTTDYESRFRLVFSANAVETETFAYYNGSEWVVNGTGTMQLVDMTGRVLSSETVNGIATVNTNGLSAGVYVMRLVNGNDVKTQKIVVK